MAFKHANGNPRKQAALQQQAQDQDRDLPLKPLKSARRNMVRYKYLSTYF